MTRNMFGFPKRLYEETRRHFRVKEAVPIKWTIGGLATGTGRVCDISSTGALIEAHVTRPIGDGTVIALEQEAGPLGGFLPTEGRIVWSKSKGFIKKSTLCGVEFTHTSSEVNDRLQKRIQDRISKMELGDKILSIVTILLVIVMLSLGGIVLSQRSSISQTIEQSNSLALSAFGQQAKIYRELLGQYKALQTVYAQLQGEYTATRVLLAQTESLLVEARRQYAEAQTEINSLRGALAQAKVATLDENVKVLIAQRDGLRQDLQSLQAEINALAAESPEALQAQTDAYKARMGQLDVRMKNLKYETLLAGISEQQKQIQLSKKRIHELKVQAALTRREAQDKKDEVALIQGNQGFFTKDGKAFLRKDAPVKKVNINVSAF